MTNKGSQVLLQGEMSRQGRESLNFQKIGTSFTQGTIPAGVPDFRMTYWEFRLVIPRAGILVYQSIKFISLHITTILSGERWVKVVFHTYILYILNTEKNVCSVKNNYKKVCISEKMIIFVQ